MKISKNVLKWVLRFYPPFFFQRIWVKKIHDNFLGIDITIHKSFLNINANKTIFGGTIFSAIDPCYPILLDQYFKHQGISKTVAWLKTADIAYIKPGHHNLNISIKLDEAILKNAYQIIKQEGKVIETFHTEVFDKFGTLCAIAQNEIYIRDLEFDFENKINNQIIQNNANSNTI
ncbi:MAG: DUF4442 domain-containing protein [Sphingobacterium sp.]